jgi:protein-disulfide isomerase
MPEPANPAQRQRLILLLGLLAAAAVIVVVAIVVSSGGGSDDKTTTPAASSGGGVDGTAETKALFSGIPQKGITLGRSTAPVTIVEFADPQCPFCKDYTINEMPALVRKYVKSGQAKMELRYLAFLGDDSVTAAHALEAAGLQDRLWQASDLLYRNQGEENSGYITDDFLNGILTAAGADAAKALSQASSSEVNQQLGAAKTLASRYGVDSTPTLLVGATDGDLKAVEGTPTAEGVGQLVEAALAKGGA